FFKKYNNINYTSKVDISNQVKKQIILAKKFSKKDLDTQIIYSAFSRFLPEEIINDLLIKDSEKDLMTGENRSIVALFSHIRNFDYIMDNNNPDAIVNFLNQHFTNMVKIIKKYGGSVDKFIGDAVYAIFGAPISYIDNSVRAAKAAVEMINEYQNIDFSEINLPSSGFSIGVGLNEGPAIIGNIGCSDKFDYTAIGDTINLAARLESLTKHYKTPILISEKVKNHLDKEYTTRIVDIARVKGKSEPTKIYSLEIDSDKFSEQWFDAYRKGVKMYCIGNWHTAINYFEKADNIIKQDFPTNQFIGRCKNYAENPPINWDGSSTLDFK
ncbi:MAG: adenylate/guanylate cyclase domain-containing protein, partial [Spirochaetales bacterium]|nr:adenylate/guanylate cyclase domain-containing protein [Spirochaetales bacterium]